MLVLKKITKTYFFYPLTCSEELRLRKFGYLAAQKNHLH